ncbi:MAG: hypothetical protein V4693_11800 [Pseudomonadota bacterium]
MAGDNPAGMTAKGAGRRRFARAGAGASAGVLLTLASQPAMAVVCTSPSGTVSGNSSRKTGLHQCVGRSPGYWKTHHDEWRRLASTNGDALFRLTFYCGGKAYPLTKYSCFDVVDPDKVTNGDDPDNVAMHIMATLLNVRSGKITFLTTNQVLAIWYSYATKGTYTPTVGVTWGGAKIVDYLTSTMI